MLAWLSGMRDNVRQDMHACMRVPHASQRLTVHVKANRIHIAPNGQNLVGSIGARNVALAIVAARHGFHDVPGSIGQVHPRPHAAVLMEGSAHQQALLRHETRLKPGRSVRQANARHLCARRQRCWPLTHGPCDCCDDGAFATIIMQNVA